MKNTKFFALLAILVPLALLLLFSTSIVGASENRSNHVQQASETPPRPTATPQYYGFKLCATESPTSNCVVTSASTPQPVSVRYGENNQYIFKAVSTSIGCNNTAFGGDPITQTPKKCWSINMPMPSYNGWTVCAKEGGTCEFSGTRVVAYGISSVGWRLQMLYKTFTNGAACANSSFDYDPVPNKAKICFLSDAPAGPSWIKCSDQGSVCMPSRDSKYIAYGKDGSFVYKKTNQLVAVGTTAPGATSMPVLFTCTDAAFGVTAGGTANACYYIMDVKADPNGWMRCASEDQTCYFDGGRAIGYGASTSFRYLTSSSGELVCSNSVFGGDPISGVVKACYVNSFVAP